MSTQPHGKVAPILALIGSLLLLAGILWGVTAGQELTRVVPTCDVYGPTDAVPNLALEGFYTFPLDNVTYESIGKMGGPGELTGDYIIVCGEGDGVVVGPPLDVRNDVGAVRAFIGAVIVGGTGAVLLVAGGVMWLMGRRAAEGRGQPAGQE